MIGTLTLRGVSQEVTLDVTLNALKRYPLPPFRRTAGFSASTTLSRRAFGITLAGVIGDAVQVRIEAEATLDRSDARNSRSRSTPTTTAPRTLHDRQEHPAAWEVSASSCTG